MGQCFTCWPGAANCNPIHDYQRLTVAEHGRLSGEAAMQVCVCVFACELCDTPWQAAAV